MSSRALIFGASGYLGRRLFVGFPELNVLGTVFRRQYNELTEIDLRDTSAAISFAQTVAPDVVIYAAALSDTASCEQDKVTARLVNTTTPAAIASTVPCPMIYISSDYVFDGSQAWYHENSVASPISHYGKTKLAGEQAVLSAGSRNVVLRISGLFDEEATSKGHLSASSSGRVDLISNPLHVDDAVSAVRTILRERVTGILHAAGPSRMTRYDLLQLSRLRFRDAPDVVPIMACDAYERPACSALSCNRLQSIGWSARRPAMVFAPAAFDYDDLHLPAHATPKNDVLVFDCVGALLSRRNVPSDHTFDHVDQACGQVTDEDSFWSRAVDDTGDQDVIDRISDRYLINPGLWRDLIRFRLEGYKLIAANNGAYATFSRWCDRLGIDIWFYDAVNSVEVGCEKSTSAFFEALASRAKCRTSDLVIYDDSSEVCLATRGTSARPHLTSHVRNGPLDSYLVDSAELGAQHSEPEIDVSRAVNACEPDARFFRQLRVHATILRQPERRQYFMLSAGTNLLSSWRDWQRLSSIETEEPFAQAWYTAQSGFPLLSHSAAIYENTIALGRFSPDRSIVGRSVAMTFGASQALALVLDHIAALVRGASLLVIEPCYPIVFRQASRSGIDVSSVAGNDASLKTMLPPADEVISRIKLLSPTALLLSTPSNPSGERFTDPDLREIAKACAFHGTILIVDRVGELVNDVPTTRALAQTSCWRNGTLQYVVINSFSKSEALAGYRIGYVIGSSQIIDAVSARQLHDAMNPPTVPALPVFLTFIVRCALILQQGEARSALAHYANRVFRTTTAIASKSVYSKVGRLLDKEFETLCESYASHQTELMQTISTNESLFHNVFDGQILAAAKRCAGLNKAVVLAESVGCSEDRFCREILNRSGVALLTESCFRASVPPRPWYWTRISLAAPAHEFAAACHRMFPKNTFAIR